MRPQAPGYPRSQPARGLGAAAERLGDPAVWSGLILRSVLFVVLVSGAAVLVAASLAPTATVAATLLDSVDGDLFDFPPLPDNLGEPAERSVVLARDGSPLAVLRAENRKTVSLDEVPIHVHQAVIATEDTTFRQHQGVNWRAIIRAAMSNVQAGEITGGGSTITQQLVKNLVVGAEQTLDRKLREAVYAIELEQRLSKDEILQAYLNETYFANGVYGIGTAAEYYWGKDIGDLTVDEGALLAGMIRSPERNDPQDNPKAARLRRNIVLDQMAREGYLSSSEAQRYQDTPVRLDIHPLEEPRNPFFVDYVRALLKEDPALGPDRRTRDLTVLRGGLTIHTTLDPRLQEAAQEAVEEILEDQDGPLGALTAVDPRTGEVLAIGFGPKPYGKGPGQTEVNPAIPGLGSSGRQPGSAFKVFQLVTALEDGIPPSYTFQADSRYTHTDPACTGHTIGNYADASHGLLDMVQATARSSNTYYAHLLDLTGPERLAEVAGRMGITTPLEPFCSLVLGAQEVFPLDMAAAFGTLANKGVHCPPVAIDRVVERSGRTISRGGGACSRAVDAGVAARATALLRGPIEGGTASRNGRIGRPAAGKTGTTNDARDAWFVGYVPQLSAAAWIGHEVPRRMSDDRCGREVTGGCLPTMVWQSFMTRAIEILELPVESFPSPPPIPSAIVPSVVGEQEDDAIDTLEDAGFRARVTEVEHWRPAGTVVDQTPPGGSRTARGGVVNLDVSDGQAPIPRVPLLLGMTVEEATERLSEMSLVADIVEAPVDDAARVGRVLSQDPPFGSVLEAGDQVRLTVGRARTPEEEPSPDPTPDTSSSPSPSESPSESPSPSPSSSPSSSPSPEPPPGRGSRPSPTPSENDGDDETDPDS